MHQLFFPPRFQFVALEKDANRLPAHMRRQLPLHRLLGNQPHTPPRRTRWRRTADHGDDPLALACVQRSLLAGSRLFVQCRPQSFFFITPSNGSHRFSGYADIGGHLRHFLPAVELAQDRSPPQHTRRFLAFPQHLPNLLPILPPQLDMHTMVALHVPTMGAFCSPGKWPQRYIFIQS